MSDILKIQNLKMIVVEKFRQILKVCRFSKSLSNHKKRLFIINFFDEIISKQLKKVKKGN